MINCTGNNFRDNLTSFTMSVIWIHIFLFTFAFWSYSFKFGPQNIVLAQASQGGRRTWSSFLVQGWQWGWRTGCCVRRWLSRRKIISYRGGTWLTRSCWIIWLWGSQERVRGGILRYGREESCHRRRMSSSYFLSLGKSQQLNPDLKTNYSNLVFMKFKLVQDSIKINCKLLHSQINDNLDESFKML